MVSARRRVVARGRVQGVFFRDATRREAGRRGVAGWARNRGDGAAEAVFEGEPQAVEAMVAFVRGGPGHAHVAGVDVETRSRRGFAGSASAERGVPSGPAVPWAAPWKPQPPCAHPASASWSGA